MRRMVVQILIMSPYFYIGSIWGRKMSKEYFAKNEWMHKYKYFMDYCYFMVGLIGVFFILMIAGGGSDE